MIVGAMTDSNITALTGAPMRAACLLSGDPLAPQLTPSGWPVLIGGNSDPGNSDAIVPVTSQRNMMTAAMTAPGLIHSAGVRCCSASLVRMNWRAPH